MFSKTQWFLGLTVLMASGATGCSMTESRPAVSGVTPVECAGATLHSAEEAARYASCEAVQGDLRVLNSELRDLTALERIRSVSGTLEIAGNPHLDDLTGLDRLSSVGKLQIENNADLDDLAGLSNLTHASSIVIRHNHELTSLRGLEGLTRADQVVLAGNGLFGVAGLSNLREVGELAVVGNPKLTTCAASST